MCATLSSSSTSTLWTSALSTGCGREDILRSTRSNAVWLKAAIARMGWFDISRYGEDASQGAWLLVQHSDHDLGWQRQMLAVLEPRVRRGDMQGKYYAYLADRVATNSKLPQLYGTQGRCAGP